MPVPSIGIATASVAGATAVGPVANAAIVPHTNQPHRVGTPKQRVSMKARRFQQLWAQRAHPPDCLQLVDEATTVRGRGDVVQPTVQCITVATFRLACRVLFHSASRF